MFTQIQLKCFVQRTHTHTRLQLWSFVVGQNLFKLYTHTPYRLLDACKQRQFQNRDVALPSGKRHLFEFIIKYVHRTQSDLRSRKWMQHWLNIYGKLNSKWLVLDFVPSAARWTVCWSDFMAFFTLFRLFCVFTMCAWNSVNVIWFTY